MASFAAPIIGGVASSLAGRLFGGGGGQTQEIRNFIPPELRPLLGDAADAIQQDFAGGGRQFFTDPRTVGFSDAELAGQQALLDLAAGGFGGALPQITDAFGQALSGTVDEANISRLVQSAANPILSQLERVLPGVSNQAIAAGQSGSSRQGIAEGLLASEAQQNIQNATNQIIGQALQDAQTQRTQALGLSPQILSQLTAPGQLQLQVGGQQRALEQQQLQDVINLFNEQQLGQQQNIDSFINRLTSLISPQAGQTVTTQGPQANPLQDFAGGAALFQQLFPSGFGGGNVAQPAGGSGPISFGTPFGGR